MYMVATHELLQDVFGISVPRILAWSSDAASNPVGAEYIIEEKASGVRLDSLYNICPREVNLKSIRQVADVENTLTSISFPKHGSVYFKDDLRSLTGDAEDLNIDPTTLKCFSIGPLTTTELCNNARKDMELERGPWQDPSEYTQALGRNEMA
ncbi:hypothetical protein PISL3812_01028 [Talaromyces islandicus]|uniref:Aminoglycoside phosphotransferase domain-containing protein n=1 Tax=Talaromyces islandicus TaxID=28573 RepID=A0A0U1LL06_TALIS|nr:hypothetical protein PISL3812_01028 [Talaromyces islandicus]